MFTNRNLAYGVVALVVAGVAVLAGMPAYFLLVLACPVMMFFMMASMSGGNTHKDTDAPEAKSSTKVPTPDGSHDRI
jgi:flagellar biosynthesis component FlhA